MDPSLQLYGDQTGNCLRAAIALEEAGVPYEVIKVHLQLRQHKEPAFLALNSRGVVPVMTGRSASGSPLVLTQSNAIMLYAAELTPGKLLPARGTAAHARALERFVYFITDVIAPSHAAFALKTVIGSEDSVARLNAKSLEALAAAELFLVEAPYIAGPDFTLADISAFTIARASHDALDWTAVPNMHRWYQRIGERAAVQRGLHVFDDPRPR